MYTKQTLASNELGTLQLGWLKPAAMKHTVLPTAKSAHGKQNPPMRLPTHKQAKKHATEVHASSFVRVDSRAAMSSWASCRTTPAPISQKRGDKA
mmetsp:Transcript_82682/g.232798  ORF Transcript_82682/g.232798 Transcript_82682/m.232798 type:complete len:95 (-) Transcript_82682:573-857(-)